MNTQEGVQTVEGGESQSGSSCSPSSDYRGQNQVSTQFGILNHLGDLWTQRVFETQAEAKAYAADYQRKTGINLSKHRVVWVEVRIRLFDDGAQVASTTDAGQASGTDKNPLTKEPSL